MSEHEVNTTAHRSSYPMGNKHHGTPERPDWGTFCVECKDSWPCDVSILAARLADAEARAEAAEALHRDLTRRLGFGDNITEPMADNDTIVRWFEERGREADEWRESQRWRDECYEKGHPEDEDCHECDPTLRLETAKAKVARVEALADEWAFNQGDLGNDTFLIRTAAREVREALRGDQ